MNVLIIDSGGISGPDLERVLTENSFAVKTIGQDFEILSLNALSEYQLIVMVEREPLEQAFTFAAKIRSHGKTQKVPLALICPIVSEAYLIEALDRGFDDVFTTSTNSNLLIRKFKGLISRSVIPNSIGFVKNGISLDLRSSTVFVKEEILPLTTTEFKLLKELLFQENSIVNRNTLQEKVFGYKDCKNRSMDVHLYNMRKKLEPYGFTIEAVRGLGCRIKSFDTGE